MKLAFISACLLLIGSEATKGNKRRRKNRKSVSVWRNGCDTPPTCTNGQYLRHPCDCQKYYFCSNGNALLQQCGPGTIWDQNSLLCNFEWAVDCVLNPPTTTTEVTTTVDPNTCDESVTCGSAGQFIINPCDCTKYFLCNFQGGSIQPVDQACGPGTYFTPGLNICSFDDSACVADTTTTTATTPIVTTGTTTEASTTTETPTTCDSSFSQSIIKSDNTIRLYYRADWCVGFSAGEQIWYGPCDTTDNTEWQYNSDTRQIVSVSNTGFCWSVDSVLVNSQLVKLAPCDASADHQRFVAIEGRIHLEGNSRFCVSYHEGEMGPTGTALIAANCYSNTFGNACNEISDADDQTVRVPMLESLCWFKRHLYYQAGHTIYVAPCDRNNANPHKAGKYQFSYDASTKMILAVGSTIKHPDYCLTVTEGNRVKKQRMRIALCDTSDQKQKFTVNSGRVYSDLNPTACAGYEYYRLRDGMTSVPLVFYNCLPNSFALEAVSN